MARKQTINFDIKGHQDQAGITCQKVAALFFLFFFTLAKAFSLSKIKHICLKFGTFSLVVFVRSLFSPKEKLALQLANPPREVNADGLCRTKAPLLRRIQHRQ